MVDQPCRGARKVRGAEVPESYLEAFIGSLDAFVEQMKKVKQSDSTKFAKFQGDLNKLIQDKKVGDAICSFEKEKIIEILDDADDKEKMSVMNWLQDNKYFAFEQEEQTKPDQPAVATVKEESKPDQPVADPVKEEPKTDKPVEVSVVKPITDNENTELLVDLDPEKPSNTPYLITAVALAVVAAGSAAAYIYMKKK